MKELFRLFKKEIYFVTGFIALLILVLFIRLIFSVSHVSGAYNKMELTDSLRLENRQDSLWQNPQYRQMKKEITWLQQQLDLSKDKSISMGINLHDSVVQVQLKGTVLFQGKIVEQKPRQFLDRINRYEYDAIFGKPAVIDTELANTPKRPIIRVAAPKNENEKAEIKSDSIKDERFKWNFHTDNNLNVVIFGTRMNRDSLLVLNINRDIFRFRSDEVLKGKLSKDYSPTLFIWLNDKDAKAIYRALPEKAKVVVRN